MRGIIGWEFRCYMFNFFKWINIGGVYICYYYDENSDEEGGDGGDGDDGGIDDGCSD